MSGNKKDSKSNEGGFGLGAAVLLGAGAAAVGFLARDVWTSYQEMQGQVSQLRSTGTTSPPPSQPNSTSDWEEKPDEHLGARRKQRDTLREQNIPDEMKCVVCLENPREICLVPCGHVCLCEDCAEKIEPKCPMCQQVIKNKKAIYI